MCVNGTEKSASTSCLITWSTSWLATRATWAATARWRGTRRSSWRPNSASATWKLQPSATAMWNVLSSCSHGTSMSWWRWVRSPPVTAGMGSRVASPLKFFIQPRRRRSEKRAATADFHNPPVIAHLCISRSLLTSAFTNVSHHGHCLRVWTAALTLLLLSEVDGTSHSKV